MGVGFDRKITLYPRFEIHRSDLARAQDAKDFEKLRFYKSQLPNIGPNHPVLHLLRLTDQSVI